MAPGVATKVISTSCALTAFAVSLLAGLFAENPTETILIRALIALVVGQVAGMIVGSIGERTVAEALVKYQKDRPIGSAKPDAIGATPPSAPGLSA